MSTPEDRPARLRVGVVGAGRVGAVLGAALQRAGHRVVAVSGVSEASRNRAATLLPGVPVRTVQEVVAEADLVLLTVPDDVLPGLVAGLAATGAVQAGPVRRPPLAAATARTSSTRRRARAPAAGAAPGDDVHRHRAWTSPGWPTAAFGVTAPEPLRPVAEALVVEMGGEPVWVAEAHRPLYHAALALGANHLVTLVAQSLELLRVGRRRRPAPAARAAAARGARQRAAAGRRGPHRARGPRRRRYRGRPPSRLADVSPPTRGRPTVAMARATADRALATGALGLRPPRPLLDVLAAPKEPSDRTGDGRRR